MFIYLSHIVGDLQGSYRFHEEKFKHFSSSFKHLDNPFQAPIFLINRLILMKKYFWSKIRSHRNIVLMLSLDVTNFKFRKCTRKIEIGVEIKHFQAPNPQKVLFSRNSRPGKIRTKIQALPSTCMNPVVPTFFSTDIQVLSD